MGRYVHLLLGVILVAFGVFIIVYGFTNENETDSHEEEVNMTLTSPAFDNEAVIPTRFTCDGDNISPLLDIADVPEGTQSLVLIVDDPDAPAGSADPGWVHWVLFNIAASTAQIAENAVPPGAQQGQTDFDEVGYGGPCPPSGEHRYFFRLFALDTALDFNEAPTKADVEAAMDGRVLEQATLMGRYSRSN